MTIFQAFVLGIVQGATEFLPISSSAHLVLVPWLLRWDIDPEASFIFNILVQWGTLLAVVYYFRHDLWALLRAAWRGLISRHPLKDSKSRLAWLILAASIPATVVGIALKDQVSQAFENPQVVCSLLLLTAAGMVASEHLGRRDRPLETLSTIDAVWIGITQAFALFPGISRSGATIAGGLVRHLKRPHAARFSFLIAIPVMIGAGLVALVDLMQLPDGHNQIGALLVGFLSAVIVGYYAIRWLIHYLSQKSLKLFAIYCTVLAVLGLLASAVRG